MKYYVIHRKQIDSEFIIESFKGKTTAECRRNELKKFYHDVLIVDQNNINEMYLQTRISK